MPVEYIHTRGRPHFLNALFSLGGLFVVASGYALMHTISSQDFRSIFLFLFILIYFFTKILIAIHGARVPGSVFKIKFRGLARGFESF